MTLPSWRTWRPPREQPQRLNRRSETCSLFHYVPIDYSSCDFVKVIESKATEKKINEARESYRPAAARASLLYFILNDLNKINPLYQFSLKVQLVIHNFSLSTFFCTFV